MARTRIVVGFVAAFLALTACGGDNTNTNSNDSAAVADSAAPVATQSADATTEAPADTEVGGVVAIDIAPCDLVTADDVAAATGLEVFEVRDQPPIDCIFDLGDEAGVEVWVTIEDGQGRFAGPANLFKEYMLLEESAEVPNVGERAVCCPFRAIAVDAGGGRFIAVSVSGGYNELAEPSDVLISLANTALERLG